MSFAEKKVLIVADSKTLVIILKDLLVSIGFSKENLGQAEGKEAAWNYLKQCATDLIISNLWFMDSFNGIQLLEEIRAHNDEKIKNTPFLIATGDERSEYLDQAKEKGVDGYLAKPFTTKTLKSAVDKIYSKFEITQFNRLASLGPSDNFSGMKVLIVDDSQANRSILKQVLDGQGFEFKEAESAEVMLDIVSVFKPDIILLDVILEGMNGYEACRRLNANENTSDYPVIFITSKSDLEGIVEGFSAGGTDYITKPFKREEVILRVKKHLHLQKILKDKEVLISELLELKANNQSLIEELTATKDQLELVAKSDPLTELPNRRGISERIDVEKFRFERNQRPFSILLGDVDFFKSVNDNYGHDAGDFLLKEIADLMTKTVRKQDMVGRWGGEEFLILFPETSLEGGKVASEKIRKKIEDQQWIFKDQKISATMSFGLSVYEDLEKSVEDCIKQADELLYKAKKSGRNQISY